MPWHDNVGLCMERAHSRPCLHGDGLTGTSGTWAEMSKIKKCSPLSGACILASAFVFQERYVIHEGNKGGKEGAANTHRFKVSKAVSAERGQLSRLWGSWEVRAPDPQVARVDNRLSNAGAPPPARVSGANTHNRVLSSLSHFQCADTKLAYLARPRSQSFKWPVLVYSCSAEHAAWSQSSEWMVQAMLSLLRARPIIGPCIGPIIGPIIGTSIGPSIGLARMSACTASYQCRRGSVHKHAQLSMLWRKNSIPWRVNILLMGRGVKEACMYCWLSMGKRLKG